MEQTQSTPMTQENSNKIGFKFAVSELLTFAKSPTLIAENTSLITRQKFSFLIQLLKFELLLLPVLIPILLLTKKYTGAVHISVGDGLWAYLFVVIFAPVIEEILFRYPLRFKTSAFGLFLTFVSCYLSYRFLNEGIPQGAGIITSICAFPLYRYLVKLTQQPLERIWSNNFKYIFHATAIIFGLIHIFNYENITNYFFAIPLVLSQLVSGYTLGFTRLKFGLRYSILLHCIWNVTVSIALLIELITRIF